MIQRHGHMIALFVAKVGKTIRKNSRHLLTKGSYRTGSNIHRCRHQRHHPISIGVRATVARFTRPARYPCPASSALIMHSLER